MKKLYTYFEPILKHPFLVLFEIFINSFLSITQLIIIELFRRIIKNMENGLSFDVNYNFLIFAGIFVLIPPFLRIITYKNDSKVFVLTNEFLQTKYLKKFIYLDNEKISTYGIGKLISIIKGGIDNWSDQLWQLYNSVIPQIITYLIVVFYLCFIDIRLFFPILFFTFFLFIFVYFVNKKTHLYRVKTKELHDILSKQIAKVLMEKFTILKNNKIDQEIKTINKFLWQTWEPGHKKGFFLLLLKFGTETILDIVKILFIVLVGVYGIYKNMNISDIATIMLLLNLLSRYATRTTEFYRQLTSQSPHIFKMIDFYEKTPYINGFDIGQDLIYDYCNISIKNVSFKYESQKQYTFDDFSLEIQGKKRTAIVGLSGVGKSTLIKLIMRFVSAEKGIIEVDGTDLSKVSLKSYYSIVGYLPQEPSLFDGTIIDNLVYALEENLENGFKPFSNNTEKIYEVLKQAECDFVFKFSDGINTEIGEKGIRLSGGEKQRLAIARLLLQNPKIIILDEPTSALDSISEVKITNALKNLCKGKTVIIIAHRLQTVKESDRIIVLGKNTVLEDGTHEELILKNGVYSKMVDLQNGTINE